MFSAYLRRPPRRSGRVPAVRLATIHPVWSIHLSPALASYHSSQPVIRTKHGLRRQFSSTGRQFDQHASAAALARDARAIESIHSSKESFEGKSASTPSEAERDVKAAFVPSTERLPVAADLSNDVRFRHILRHDDLSRSNTLFPGPSAAASSPYSFFERDTEEDIISTTERPIDETDLFRALLPLPRQIHGRDLSYSDPSLPKRPATASAASHDGNDQPEENPRFRANKDIRLLVARWAPSARRLSRHDGDPQLYQQALKQEEENVLDAKARAILATRGYTTANLNTWCWILMSSNANEASRRYRRAVTLALQNEAPPIPHLVALQILRASFMRAQDFRALIAAIRESSSYHSQWRPGARSDSTTPEDGGSKDQYFAADNADIETATSAKHSWDAVSAMILLVRSLRHARVVAPESFETIIDIAGDLLLDQCDADTTLLTSYCNRLLRLISLHTTAHPLRNNLIQQGAQVRLVERMIAHRPELPITREGYRSLISVQLAHRKLPQEVAFARVKSLTWPPWREDQLGMDASLTYPGRESRALKLLRRMNEAGYEHGWWEACAKILAGWDTDHSPTIQTRRLLPVLVGNIDVEYPSGSVQPPGIWAARILATRTVREAWAAFLSYRKETLQAFKPLSHEPFESMFAKLFAKAPQKDADVVPGDGTETWSDPASELDVIYVDKEPPTVDQLYTQMWKDGVRPSRRFLPELLLNSQELKQGVRYINDAVLLQTWKDVLLAAHRVPADHVRITLGKMKPRLLAAFICHLLSARAGMSGDAQEKTEAGMLTLANPRDYALNILQQSKSQDRPVYIGALNGLLNHAISPLESERSFVAEKTYVRDVGAQVRSVMRLMEANGVDHDFMTFQQISRIYHWMLRRGPWPRWRTGSDPLSQVKEIFAHCVHSESDAMHWLESGKWLPQEAVPDPYHLRLMVESLGMFQDTMGLRKLIEWMSAHKAEFEKVHRDIRTAQRQMRTVMIVSRIFIEGWLTINMRIGDFETINSEGLYVPTAEDCSDFMRTQTGWVRRHQRYLQARVSTVVRDDRRAALSTEPESGDYPLAEGS